jgi:nitric-oxide synthase, bacterial
MPPCPFHLQTSAPTLPKAVAAGLDPTAELAFLEEVYPAGIEPERRTRLEGAIAADQAAPLTSKELTWAGRIAWRNNSRCIGRLHWRSLIVRDHRGLETPDAIAESLREHLTLAQGDGAVRSYLTVFAPPERCGGPAPRIWNSQLCGYAGYRGTGGTILGDPANTPFTDLALQLGWQGPKNPTAFDLLPWIISGRDGQPQLFPLPQGLVREIPIHHPEHSWFEALGLRWYAVPVITHMRFRAAGTDYPASPFNGWYMGTEIGSRNLGDTHRYNLLPLIADRLGLDRRTSRSLWQDRALLELNQAVLHSYAAAGVKMIDHHTASEEFIKFRDQEASHDRAISARWDWIVPPMSASATRVFHTSMSEFATTPDFHHQPAPSVSR